MLSYLIRQVTDDHLGEEGEEDGGHDGWGDVLPAEAEEQPRPGASHQLYVLGGGEYFVRKKNP